MPYSIPLVPDRQAVGQATYQLRRFQKQVMVMEIPQPFKQALLEKISSFENFLKGAVIDYNDDGTILESSPDNDLCLGK